MMLLASHDLRGGWLLFDVLKALMVPYQGKTFNETVLKEVDDYLRYVLNIN